MLSILPRISQAGSRLDTRKKIMQKYMMLNQVKKIITEKQITHILKGHDHYKYGSSRKINSFHIQQFSLLICKHSIYVLDHWKQGRMILGPILAAR